MSFYVTSIIIFCTHTECYVLGVTILNNKYNENERAERGIQPGKKRVKKICECT